MNVIKYQFKHNVKLFNICEVLFLTERKVGLMFKLQNNTGEVLLGQSYIFYNIKWPQLIWFKHSLMLTFQKQQNSFIQNVKNKNYKE